MTDVAVRAIPRLHVVTDDQVLGRVDFAGVSSRLLDVGGSSLALHLRGPRTGGGRLFQLATELLPIAEAGGALLVINDRVDVALAVGVRAVHLGGRSLGARVVRDMLAAPPRDGEHAIGPSTAPCLVGASVHSVAEAASAWKEGVDYVLAGNVFETPSHVGRAGLGIDGLEAVVRAAPAGPVMAIGGVTPGALPTIRAAGAYGVAVIRGVWGAVDPAEAVREYISGLVTDRNNGVEA